MAAEPQAATDTRRPLSRDRVLRAAVDLADRDGIAALTMRHLAQELGVEAMSLYHHVDNEDAILAGVVEVVVGEITAAADRVDAPEPEDDWKQALRQRILAAREVLLRHPWAPGLIEARTTLSPSVVLWFESVLAIMRRGGFSWDLAHQSEAQRDGPFGWPQPGPDG